MKKIGIVGGLGPESTIDYYKGIINAFRQHQVGLDAYLIQPEENKKSQNQFIFWFYSKPVFR